MIQPLGDYVVIEEIKIGTTVGGIILPDNVTDTGNEDFLQGLVIAISEGRVNDDGKVIPPRIRPGDKVLYLKHGPGEIKIEGKKYLLAREGGLLAIYQ